VVREEDILGVQAANYIVPHLTEAEKPALQNLLTLAIAGHRSYPLVRFVRAIGERITGKPDVVPEMLTEWLRLSANLDLDTRWPEIYNFFLQAQLPGFVEHLHWLWTADLPDHLREILETAWNFWPKNRPVLKNQPEGEEFADVAKLRYDLAFFLQEADEYFREPGVCSTKEVGRCWEQFRMTYEELLKVEKYLERENARIEREAAEAAEAARAAEATEATTNEDPEAAEAATNEDPDPSD
jgi:hypothetical protein